MQNHKVIAPASAWQFVVLLGIVSLLADLTYEGARAIIGPFLASLGATATVVGLVAGLGELVGYGLRLVSGYVCDRSRRYWPICLSGYFLNLVSVPLLAFAGTWPVAAVLIVAERLGKAIRTPARDVMLSSMTKGIGRGAGFGLHEALDQVGAVAGPLICACILYFHKSFAYAFGVLALPAILAFSTLLVARARYPYTHECEPNLSPSNKDKLPLSFWLYLVGVGFIALGYADFPLIAYHFKATESVSESLIPVLYAVAMAVDAVAALILGRLYDRKGLLVLLGVLCLSSLFAPLVFSRSLHLAIAGMALWGIGMGAQESIVRAAIADMVSPALRGSAYGMFGLVYGVAWCTGSIVIGMLYDSQLIYAIVFSVIAQLCSIPILVMVAHKLRTARQSS